MPLSRSTLRDLQRERAELTEQRQALEAKIAAIDALLASATPPPTQASLPIVANGNGDAATKDVAPGQLRAAVLQIVRERPGVLRPEITRAIVTAKLPMGGTTPPSTRVYNELWRLEQLKQVRREGNSYFIVA